jgi:histidinol-phosphatase
MTLNIDDEYLERIVNTALEAAEQTKEILLEKWRAYRSQDDRDMPYTDKKDLTPVTPLDLEVETKIREIIAANFPDHQILGEEFGMDRQKKSPYLWVLDPIDGTKAFIRGLSNFATQIAVMHEGKVIVGVSSAPALKETLVAFKNGGAFSNKKRIRVSNVDDIYKSYLCHGNIKYFHRIGKLPQLNLLFEQAWCARGFGDFWGYHLLANGGVEVMMEAMVKIWDIAALSIIVEEAGGRVTDIHGNPVSVDTTTLIATNGRIHDKILSMMQS